MIKLVQDGKVDLKPFITGKIALDELVDKGFDTLIHRNDTAVKILVSPSGRGSVGAAHVRWPAIIRWPAGRSTPDRPAGPSRISPAPGCRRPMA